MNKLILTLMFYSFVFAQEHGYVKFNSDKTWIIEISDTLITSADYLKLENGLYSFTARPQISYSWPAVFIKSEIFVSAGDTSFFQLTGDQSTVDNIDINADLPSTTSYRYWDYHPNSDAFPKLKTGLLLTSVAANWLSFYLKREADKNYTKYDRASSVSDIDKYYNLAGDLDNASAVMLSISAAALAAYIYIALQE